MIPFERACDLLSLYLEDLRDWWYDQMHMKLSYVVCDILYDSFVQANPDRTDPIELTMIFIDKIEEYKTLNPHYTYLFTIYSDIALTILHAYLLEDEPCDVVGGWNVPHE